MLADRRDIVETDCSGERLARCDEPNSRDPVALEKAVGISLRTLQRRKADPGKLLSREQSGRTWKFAEILAKATAVLGSRAETEQWLKRPATETML